MTQELLYTSAPRGLKPGSRGFCTVVSTQGMSAPLAAALESLSGYRPVFPPGDPQVGRNPVVWSHLKLAVAGRPYSILSRVADYGLDYSQRTNKIAHHVVLEPSERTPAGPAWLMEQPGFMQQDWDNEPRILPAGRPVRQGDAPPGVCTAWEQLTGDAGWAGVLAEAFLADPERPAYLHFEPGMDPLPLLAEALALLPPNRRWDVTFSTYFTTLPPGTTCAWRCVLNGSAEANQSRRYVHALRINLCEPLGTAQGGELVEVARRGTVKRARGGAIPGWGEAARDEVKAPLTTTMATNTLPMSTGAYSLSARDSSSSPPPPPRSRRRIEDAYRKSHKSSGNLRLFLTAGCAVLLIIPIVGLTFYWSRPAQSTASISARNSTISPDAPSHKSPQQSIDAASRLRPAASSEAANEPIVEVSQNMEDIVVAIAEKPSSTAGADGDGSDAASTRPDSGNAQANEDGQNEENFGILARTPRAIPLSEAKTQGADDKWKLLPALELPKGSYTLTFHAPAPFSDSLRVSKDGPATVIKQLASEELQIASFRLRQGLAEEELWYRPASTPERRAQLGWCVMCLRTPEGSCRAWYVLSRLPVQIDPAQFTSSRLEWHLTPSSTIHSTLPVLLVEHVTIAFDGSEFRFTPATPSSNAITPDSSGELLCAKLSSHLAQKLRVHAESTNAPAIKWKTGDKPNSVDLQIIRSKKFWDEWTTRFDQEGGRLMDAKIVDEFQVSIFPNVKWMSRDESNPSILQFKKKADARIKSIDMKILALGNNEKRKDDRDQLLREKRKYEKARDTLIEAKQRVDDANQMYSALQNAEVTGARLYYEIEIDGNLRQIDVVSIKSADQ